MTKTSNNPFCGAIGIKEKRAVLASLSTKAKKVQRDLVKELSNSADCILPRINDILLQMYTNEENQTFKTFKGWKKSGKQVKRGEKAYCIWSKPRKATQKLDDKTEEEYQMYGVAFLFSNAQVS